MNQNVLDIGDKAGEMLEKVDEVIEEQKGLHHSLIPISPANDGDSFFESHCSQGEGTHRGMAITAELLGDSERHPSPASQRHWKLDHRGRRLSTVARYSRGNSLVSRNP